MRGRKGLVEGGGVANRGWFYMICIRKYVFGKERKVMK